MPIDRRDFIAGLSALSVASALPAIPATAAPVPPERRSILIVGPLPPTSGYGYMRGMILAESWLFDEDGDRQAIAGFATATLFIKEPLATDPRALRLVSFSDKLPWDRSRLIATGHAARFVAQKATYIRTARRHTGPILFQFTQSDPSDPCYNPFTQDFPVSPLSFVREV
jgi:hypothetical protein